MAARLLHVLVVDDSAVVREILSGLFSQEPDMTVTTAADPLIAMMKMRSSRPDVIVLDLEMPRMDGLTFLRKLMDEDPIPVVVCSGLASSGMRGSLRAIEEGAIAVVPKPKLGLKDFLRDSRLMLVDSVRGAAQARLRRRPSRARSGDARPSVAARRPPAPHVSSTPGAELVAIGASTGGPEALRVVLERMPPACPGIVMVQHMPEGFTRAFAKRLDQLCAIEVKEAVDGDLVRPGRALLAPGDRHLTVVRRGAGFAVQVREGPLVSRHRPSVDVLFLSVAQAAGNRATGILMTGMGADGADGLLEMRRAGASTIAQDEATSVVFGMPKEAITRGAAGQVLPLPAIGPAILGAAATAAPSPAPPSRG